MPKSTDFRNNLPYWISLFIILTGFFHMIVNAVWMKLAFHPNIAWFDVVGELVSKPNEFFWVILVIFAFDLLTIMIGLIILVGRSISKRQKKEL